MKKLAILAVMMMVCGTAFAGNFFHPCTSTAYQYCSNKLAKKVTLNSGAKGEGIPYQTCDEILKLRELLEEAEEHITKLEKAIDDQVAVIKASADALLREL